MPWKRSGHRLVLEIAVAATLFAASLQAKARDVALGEELPLDAGLALTAWSLDRFGPKEARYLPGEFPAQSLDDAAERQIHGELDTAGTSVKEERYREFSDLSVVASSVLPAALALGVGDEAAAGRIMTTTHALFLSNLVVTSLKHSVRRSRPNAGVERGGAPNGDLAASFPSGHSASAFAGATLVSCFFPASSPWLRGGAFALATLTAAARIQGGKHFLTDVIAGGVIGAGAALAADHWFEAPEAPLSLNFNANSAAVTYRF